MKLEEKFEKMMNLFFDIREEVKSRDKNLYERWKAGGFDITDEFVSIYPSLNDVVEQLSEDEDVSEY